MSVRPVDFNGMMQNQQNVSNVKQQKENGLIKIVIFMAIF